MSIFWMFVVAIALTGPVGAAVGCILLWHVMIEDDTPDGW